MSDIIFVRTHHNYDSYQDFWKLVELSCFPVVFTSEVDLEKDYTYILSPNNGEWKSVIDSQRNKTKRAKLINWNLERPGGSGGMTNYERDNRQLVEQGYFDEIWVSDRELARRCKFSFVVLGGHYLFNYDLPRYSEKEYDYIHLSYNSPRRWFLFSQPGVCKSDLEGMKIAPNAWGLQRHANLSKSRMMLNIHQDDFQFIEPLRYVIAALYKLPIVSEFVLDSFPYNNIIDLGIFNPSGYRLINFIKEMKMHASMYDSYIARGHTIETYKKMTEEYTFRHCVEVVL